MDFRRGAFRVASRAGGVECVQTIYAHRGQPHLLISEFRCDNSKGTAAATATIDQGRCNPLSLVDDYIYETLCPQRNASQHGYVRGTEPSGLPGVTCTLSTSEFARNLPLPAISLDVPTVSL
jgi:hypothetical protein